MAKRRIYKVKFFAEFTRKLLANIELKRNVDVLKYFPSYMSASKFLNKLEQLRYFEKEYHGHRPFDFTLKVTKKGMKFLRHQKI